MWSSSPRTLLVAARVPRFAGAWIETDRLRQVRDRLPPLAEAGPHAPSQGVGLGQLGVELDREVELVLGAREVLEEVYADINKRFGSDEKVPD